jgi:hypothetical protein
VSRESDRDRPSGQPPDHEIDRLLRTTLGGPIGESSASCLDAEKLAAWSDGALSLRESEEVELHLADCARCQTMMAVFARTVPVVPTAIPFWRRWQVRWLVPLAVASFAVVLWIATPAREPATAPAQTMAKADVAVAVPSQSKPAPPASTQWNLEGGAITDVSKANAEPTQSHVVSPQKTVEAHPAETRLQPPPSPPAAAGAASVSPPPAARALPAPMPQMPALPAAPRPTLPGSDAQGSVVTGATVGQGQTAQDRVAPLFRSAVAEIEIISANQSVNPPAAAGAAGGGGGGGGGGGRGGGRGGGGRGAASAVVAGLGPGFATPTRWHILGGTRVERSRDAGTSWEAIAIDPAVVLTGGVAPSAVTCWLIGRGGVVLLSIDGLHFDHVTFPETTDLASISAIDARQATVTTADGRAYATTDGGQTWRLQGFPSAPF